MNVTVHFDRPLSVKGYSIGFDPKGPAAFPKIGSIRYSPGNTAVIIKIHLEPRREYEMVFIGLASKAPKSLLHDNPEMPQKFVPISKVML